MLFRQVRTLVSLCGLANGLVSDVWLILAVVCHVLWIGGRLAELRPSFFVKFEPEDPRDKNHWCFLGCEVGVRLEQYVREGATEVGPVDISALLFRDVHVLAFRTEHLHSRVSQVLGHADREHVLPAAKDARANPESAVEELFSHNRQAFGRLHETVVDQPVQIHGFLVHVQEFLVFEVIVVRALGVLDHTQRVAFELTCND